MIIAQAVGSSAFGGRRAVRPTRFAWAGRGRGRVGEAVECGAPATHPRGMINKRES